MKGSFVTLLITIQLRRAVDESQKSFITEDVLYKDLRRGCTRFSEISDC